MFGHCRRFFVILAQVMVFVGVAFSVGLLGLGCVWRRAIVRGCYCACAFVLCVLMWVVCGLVCCWGECGRESVGVFLFVAAVGWEGRSRSSSPPIGWEVGCRCFTAFVFLRVSSFLALFRLLFCGFVVFFKCPTFGVCKFFFCYSLVGLSLSWHVLFVFPLFFDVVAFFFFFPHFGCFTTNHSSTFFVGLHYLSIFFLFYRLLPPPSCLGIFLFFFVKFPASIVCGYAPWVVSRCAGVYLPSCVCPWGF
jgi:hypothetical protein